MRYCKARHIEDCEYIYIGGTPVHEIYLQKAPYRWLNEDTCDEQFQVFWLDEWQDAQSIDFEFDY
jgi:hypothetical protein